MGIIILWMRKYITLYSSSRTTMYDALQHFMTKRAYTFVVFINAIKGLRLPTAAFNKIAISRVSFQLLRKQSHDCLEPVTYNHWQSTNKTRVAKNGL